MYNRISIVGGSGSGKSTLCNILSKELNLPAIHLDSINFNSNWVEIDKAERDKIILEKSNEDKWIIDGNYNKTIKERFNKADLIIWLDYSTFSQLLPFCQKLCEALTKTAFLFLLYFHFRFSILQYAKNVVSQQTRQ